MKEKHFQIGHPCAGCNLSNILHTGCVVDNDARVVQNEQKIDKDTKIIDQQFDKETL